jgi:hypothetical protein
VLGCVDSALVDPCVDLVRVEADELADLVERHPALSDESANESLCHAEAAGEPGDVEKFKFEPGVSASVVECQQVHCLWVS